MFLKDTNNFTVTKANTLTTARTINGTSFNGSANITTANWGTARTLTIGNSGKSVNGSANVSWTLADIGAAAASHTHSYLPLSGGTVTGYTYMKQGFIIHSAGAGGGTNGYIKVATIKNTGTYQNQSLYFKIAQRGKSCYNLEIRFGNADNSDPGVDLFEKDSGNVNAYLYKTSAGVWDLYIQKSESYDRIEILDYKKGSYMSGINITWSDVLASSVPSGYLTATTRNSINSVMANGYWGMATPDGNGENWIRTTTSGIIPHQSGVASNIGTESWRFSNGYFGYLDASGMIRARDRFEVANSSGTAQFGVGGSDSFWYNKAANKYVQFKNNGTLCISDKEFYNRGHNIIDVADRSSGDSGFGNSSKPCGFVGRFPGWNSNCLYINTWSNSGTETASYGIVKIKGSQVQHDGTITIQGTPISVQSSAPSIGGVWIQI